MSTLAERNRKASRNGRFAEIAASVDFATEIATNAVIDGHYDGKPLEVKACMAWITDGSNSKFRRRGRFFLQRFQHARLLEADGNYAFYVLDDDGEVLCAKLVSARWLEALGLVKPRGSTQIVWTRLWPELGV